MKKQIYELIEAVKLVALDADLQIKALPSFAYVPDEVALTLDQFLFQLDWVSEKTTKFEQVEKKIRELHNLFSEMTDNKQFTMEEFNSAKEWDNTRTLAREILAILDEPLTIPDFDWVTYVPGNSEETTQNKETIDDISNAYFKFISKSIIEDAKWTVNLLRKDVLSKQEGEISKEFLGLFSELDLDEDKLHSLEQYIIYSNSKLFQWLLYLYDGESEYEDCPKIYLTEEGTGKRLQIDDTLSSRFTKIMENLKKDYEKPVD